MTESSDGAVNSFGGGEGGRRCRTAVEAADAGKSGEGNRYARRKMQDLIVLPLFLLFFFFQAEDGIRDFDCDWSSDVCSSDLGGSPTFFAGTGTSAAPTTGVPPGDGCITTTPQNCKIIVYPNEKIETGTINSVNGIITITAPLSDVGSPMRGDELFSVTALTFGYVHRNPILQDADATRPFDYILGQTTTPSNCPQGQTCKVTGGGYIFTDAQHDHGIFSIEVTVDASGRIRGKIAYQDQGTGLDFRTALVTSAFFNGNTVTVQGTGTANGTATSFQVTVQDKGEPGAGRDTFSIQLGTGYSRSGVLQAGNIQIH